MLSGETASGIIHFSRQTMVKIATEDGLMSSGVTPERFLNSDLQGCCSARS